MSFDVIARGLGNEMVAASALKDERIAVLKARIARLEWAILPLLQAKFEAKTDPSHKAWIELGAAYNNVEFDDLHHAPMCPANHYHRSRVPGRHCTCGAQQFAAEEKAAKAEGGG